MSSDQLDVYFINEPALRKRIFNLLKERIMDGNLKIIDYISRTVNKKSYLKLLQTAFLDY
jgi:hypothetical protein